LTEKWLCENTAISILDYVEYVMHMFTRACEIELGAKNAPTPTSLTSNVNLYSFEKT
jgi:hypothetical protein